ncbi:MULTISPECIES: hypothetical protein [unclassified Pseudactinotalea]|uniref:hypothetical protein n=1 Tax=Micrococcales TaxID=85006 RepID=UPI003C7E5AE6
MSFLKRLFGRDYEVSSPTQAAGSAQPGQVDTTAKPGPDDAVQAAEPARFVVEQTFTQTGRGTMAVGKLASGYLTEGDHVRVLRGGESYDSGTVQRLEVGRRRVERMPPGTNGGVLVEGMAQPIASGDEIHPGPSN